MPDINAVLTENRSAVDDLMVAADKSESVWTTPRAAGKWSPSQVVEHVAMVLEESGNVVAGAPSKFPTLPRFVRPLVRGIFFNRILKKEAFPKAKTPKAFNPAAGPATPSDARVRLEQVLAKFDEQCRAQATSGSNMVSGIFGAVRVEDYVRFQGLHCRHHTKQMPTA